MSNNHPSRNAASAELKRHHEQYDRLDNIAQSFFMGGFLSEAHAIRRAISDLKALRKELKRLESINKSKQ